MSRKVITIEKHPDGRYEMTHHNLDGEEALSMLKWATEAVAKRIVERVGEMMGGPAPCSNVGPPVVVEKEFFFHQPRRVKPAHELALVEDFTPAPTPTKREL